MRLAAIDTAVVVAYIVGIFVLAQIVSARRARGTTTDYFLASRALPWWAIGASLIAANISAEQIVGMAGSGYAIGLAIASYEWMAAATLIVVGKFFLPIFLKNGIATMPQFLEARFGPTVRTVMAVFWLGLYVFVNLTSILWLGSLAVAQVAGVDQDAALIGLGLFALAYQIRGGLSAVALTDIVQVTLLVAGGALLSWLTLGRIGGGDALHGFAVLQARLPDHFTMILPPASPFYKNLPGIGVLVGGMWIANLSYWGFNQYIIQRALAAKSLSEAQTGIVMAAGLKLILPFVIVVPGIAAAVLAPGLAKPDAAYPTMLHLLPPGVLGLVFAALIAAIVASTASKINSIATIFTLDLFARGSAAEGSPVAGEARLVRVGRIAAAVAVVLALITARPLLGHSDQAFQFIQEYTGFFTPGITAIFLAGLFWPPASEAGALAAAIGSFVLSLAAKALFPAMPFLDRMGYVFVAAVALLVAASLARPARGRVSRIDTGVGFATPPAFNAAAVAVGAVLIGFYAAWW